MLRLPDFLYDRHKRCNGVSLSSGILYPAVTTFGFQFYEPESIPGQSAAERIISVTHSGKETANFCDIAQYINQLNHRMRQKFISENLF